MSDWISWGGRGECPVANDALVEVRVRDGISGPALAPRFQWNWAERGCRHVNDILAYRVVQTVTRPLSIEERLKRLEAAIRELNPGLNI